MNFFAQKNKTLKKRQLEIEPLKLYDSLSKDELYGYLRGVQEEVLKEWHKRREENELLIKMNTGAGKTLVGLLILYSKMLEHNKPVVYLCPDNQLLNQVIEQSKNYNIPTSIIDEKNDFPESFLNAESVLITTINKMFNGKNIFDRDKIKPIGLVIDDAHRCVEKVKDNFTVKIPSDHELYSKLIKLFKIDLKKQSMGSFEAIKSSVPHYYMKVPFWSWLDNIDNVTSLLVNYIDEKETLLFKWDLMQNNLLQYEMYFNAQRVEICPMISFSQNIITYNSTKFKYALSATFVNDSSILKDLNFSIESLLNPIVPRDRKDYGQRLILAPKRYYNNISNKDQLNILDKHIKNDQNVVVLVPSWKVADEWEKIGAEIARTENISDIIEKLKSSRGNFVVFVNRYEGIDLSGDSCNVLVIHDHPKFKFIRDQYFEDIHHETSANIIAQTIEQGMGRSVRSSNDYSIIYLMGRHILRFLRQKRNLEFFNSHTKTQLELGLSLMEGQKLDDENVVDKIVEIGNYCLNQDEDWKSYYQNFMDENLEKNSLSRTKKLKVFNSEKNAILKFIQGEYQSALKIAKEMMNDETTPIEKAWYYQIFANIIYPQDKNQSNDYLIKSKAITSRMPLPFLSNKKWKLQKIPDQFSNALNFIHSFSSINDLLLYITEINNNLIYDPNNEAEDFENALNRLGKLLGFMSSRPEKEINEGPDVLWGSNDVYLILEAKSEKLETNKVSKSDVEQLYHSFEWFKGKYIYEGQIFGVSWQPNPIKHNDVAVNNNIKVLDNKKLNELRNSLSILYNFFASQNNIKKISEENLKIEYNKLGINALQFINRYLKDIK
ncbi:DEAD/DEAH box helicase family protein [Mesoflavibacter zeaxanthinifaciens]|uniref:DEAD/DEAH box helicase family protein n=1 Tax=Mesoflavibacter zeaxanthinifaciens TaxID=393060 RepID=UPI000416F8CA|nr:DEAD/DEAH box helicase family protein [Mesoflavibacter zeaxanthinifaciens]